MHKHHFKKIGYACLIAALASIAGLWSWNTLAEVTLLPEIKYKHIIAAIVLLLLARWTLFAPHNFRRHLSAGDAYESNSN